jgi:predicted DsbA family dithiol-disulfide isomerase
MSVLILVLTDRDRKQEARMRVDIWTDVVCPWCYIGDDRFSRALAGFEHRDEVDVIHHSFELDPSIPAGQAAPIGDVLAAKYGLSQAQVGEAEARVAGLAAAEGLEFTADRAMGNTFNAHQLVHLGREHGLADRLLQRLYHAYFAEGRPVFEPGELAELAAEEGLDPDRARQALEDGSYADAVRADEAQAGQLGISGVPFFVLDGKYGVSGAQPTETFTRALEQAWRSRSEDGAPR